MSKAGLKMRVAIEDLVKVIECDHDWHVVSIDRYESGAIRKVVDRCEFCGARRTRFAP